MKYFIAYLLTDEAKKAHEHLTGEIEKKFGIKRKTPPHITLKRPFETDSINEIENILDNFVRTHKKAKIMLRGFGAFDKKVIYAAVKASSEAIRLIGELDSLLGAVSWLNFDEFEKNRNLHATLADSDTANKKFLQLWDFITLGNFDFNAWLDNISILKKENGLWDVHKKFELK